MSRKRINAFEVFPDFTRIPRRLPAAVTWAGAAVALAIFLGTIILLLANETVGLALFWGLEVPVLPLVLVLAPGLWRAVCPLAFVNQMPKLMGLSRNKRLPPFLADKAFAIAVVIFVVFVALRRPLLNSDGTAVAVMLVLAAAAAFLGGLVFTARSGWCGTFCPLGPIQREYGHAPAVLVPNTFCTQCVGCQKGCYDLAPQATLFDDVLNEEPDYAAQRRFFMSMMPGMIAGYFLQLGTGYGYGLWLAIYFGAILASAGLYQFATGFLRLEPARTASFFAAAALTLFYAFAGPIMAGALASVTGLAVPAMVGHLLQGAGAASAAFLFFNARRLALRFEAAEQAAKSTVSDRKTNAGATIRELSTGKTFAATPGETLLSAMRLAGLPVNGVCRSGHCGSDAVRIVSGSEHLSAMGADEKATLARLGHSADVRLACQCTVTGPVTIDLRVEATSEPIAPPQKPFGRVITRSAASGSGVQIAPLDPVRGEGVEKVVIIGNGAAGITAAEEVRKLGPTVQITLVSAETHRFYNRMALGRLVAGEVSLPELFMLPANWAEDRRVEVKLSTRVTSIDRRDRTIATLTGETIAFDRLILATGARATVPTPGFLGHANTFVLRNAGDAAALSQFIARRKPRRAIVIGGGVLGVEAAEALSHAGLSVGIVHRGQHLLDRNLDAIGAGMLERYLCGLAIDVATGVSITGYEGRGQLAAIRTSGTGEMKADLFVAAIGNSPNVELAQGCRLAVQRGIVVDSQMRTSDPAIFAIGDCAEAGGTVSGLWPEAVAQARIAAFGLLSLKSEEARRMPLLQMKSDGIDLISLGSTKATLEEGGDVLNAAPFDRLWWRFVIRDSEILTASFVGPPGSSGDLKSLLKKRRLGAPELAALRAGKIAALTHGAAPLLETP